MDIELKAAPKKAAASARCQWRDWKGIEDWLKFLSIASTARAKDSILWGQKHISM